MTDKEPVLAFGRWKNNAEMMRDVARLWLDPAWKILDPTWGNGRFWTNLSLPGLVGSDLDASLSPSGDSVDATALPYSDGEFEAVVLDPPYKLNGTPMQGGPAMSDKDYGVHVPTTWQERHSLIREMIDEAARVSSKVVMVKMQDQVCSGAKRWQTREFADHAESRGLVLADRFDIASYRKQPPGRRQIHSRANTSTLLVFRHPAVKGSWRTVGATVTLDL